MMFQTQLLLQQQCEFCEEFMKYVRIDADTEDNPKDAVTKRTDWG